MSARFPVFGIRISRLRGVILSLFLLIFVVVPSILRSQNSSGALRGEVEDASAARVAGALVVVQAAGSSNSRAATTNGQGEFRIEGLLPGSYRVMVTANGFSRAAGDVEVAVTVVRDINVTLKPEGRREMVNVAGVPSSITTETT